MATIIPIQGSATSSLLDVWQAHIQQQQADKAQTSSAGTADVGTANTADSTGTSNIDTQRVSDLRDANNSAKRTGQAIAGSASDASGSGGVSPIVSQTIAKLKQMLAKVMAQLDAVRNDNALPPEQKLQQTTALSAQAMSIQAQIQALMDPTKTTGTRVNTTA
ncbi:FlxA-like family protein [Pandoraea cepalis]|uniref:FlxA-like protein n=1 Tax=Pandoraea cepalis TaxID=2508294 RepID=A0A5E4YFH5_9BURK|nr:FlxA-like family protein [Pandoraea cepalis]VVE47180.1 hypothetical protein PCE31107_04479 [Pandoraea cepalis]